MGRNHAHGALHPERGARHRLPWAVDIPRPLKVYPVGVELIFPNAKRPGSAPAPIPDVLSVATEDMLACAKWQTITWRKATKGKLKAHFSGCPCAHSRWVRQRIREKGQQHLPGNEAWLAGERSAPGKYYLANLSAGINLRALAATIKA
jgi:SRSO17 transposase